eukprot:gene6571-3223_t
MAQAACFLPFLPQDNRGLDSDGTQEALHLISNTLGKLLQADVASFWQSVKTNRGLQECLDSYLQFKRRLHDDSSLGDGSQGSTTLELQLSRRVFMVLMRLVTVEQSSPKAPSPTMEERASILDDNWILDIPKLMDICVVFRPGNLQLTQTLIQKTLEPETDSDTDL